MISRLQIKSMWGYLIFLQGFTQLMFADPLSGTPQWMQLSDLSVTDMAFSDHIIYITHQTYYDENDHPISVSSWDGCRWKRYPGILETYLFGVRTIAVDGSKIYVGGEFKTTSGDPNADNIAMWDGSKWISLGEGIHANNGVVLDIVINRGEVFAGGTFQNAGGIANADGIARWDGENWNALGQGLLYVVTIAFAESGIYAGGSFTDAGGDPNADKIARWDGSAWHALGNGMGNTTYQINKIVLNEDIVYVKGSFVNAGGNPHADHIAKWDGNEWSNLGLQFEETKENWPLCTDGDFIYAQYQPNSSNVDSAKIMRWDVRKEIWDQYPPGKFECEWYSGLAAYDNDIYLTGNWTIGDSLGCGLWMWGEARKEVIITGVPDSMCPYDPPIVLPTLQSGYYGNWSGPGVANNIFNPAGLSGSLMLTFSPDPDHCIDPAEAQIVMHCSPTVSSKDILETFSCLSVFPNPTSGILHYNCHPQADGLALTKLTNLEGKVLLYKERCDSEIDISFLPPGIYFLTVQNHHGFDMAKIVRL
ncbi:MAG: T9SS type A sorting domain-containing protein [Saprospiraceae bacterium]